MADHKASLYPLKAIQTFQDVLRGLLKAEGNGRCSQGIEDILEPGDAQPNGVKLIKEPQVKSGAFLAQTLNFVSPDVIPRSKAKSCYFSWKR